jgi:hypothetical protein
LGYCGTRPSSAPQPISVFKGDVQTAAQATTTIAGRDIAIIN